MLGAIAAGALALASAIGPAAPDQPARCPALASGPQPFNPPVGSSHAYQIRLEMPSSGGPMAEFVLDYQLNWHRMGRGYRLDAVLLAPLAAVNAPPLATMAQPLVGQPVAYLVSGDGRQISLADSGDALGAVAQQAQQHAAASAPASDLAARLRAMPPSARQALMLADIRALLAGTGQDWASATGAKWADADCRLLSYRPTRMRTEGEGPAGAPVLTETEWVIDTATGLVVTETQHSWLVSGGPSGNTLVSRRTRQLRAH